MALEGTIQLRDPGVLTLAGDGGRRYQGGSQEWYGGYFQRMGGCGPTTASHLVWYLARTRPRYAGLCEGLSATRQGFLRLMEEMWEHVTPGMRGVNTTGMFVDGVASFAAARGASLDCRVLEIPPRPAQRPDWEEAAAFLGAALEADLPLAFLNLDNGGVRGLDSWHWVTLVQLDPGSGYGVILDQGRALEIKLDRWLERNRKGGGFVAAAPGAGTE